MSERIVNFLVARILLKPMLAICLTVGFWLGYLVGWCFLLTRVFGMTYCWMGPIGG